MAVTLVARHARREYTASVPGGTGERAVGGRRDDVTSGLERSAVRIGIDATCWLNRRGFGRFTRELVPRLVEQSRGVHDVVLVADRNTASAAAFPPDAEVVVARTSLSEGGGGHRAWRSPTDLWALGREAAGCGADVFFFPTLASFFPLPGSTPVVLGVHDAMTEEHPRLFFPGLRSRAFWWTKVRIARRRASAVVTPSQDARQRVARALDFPLESVATIDEAPADWFRPLTDAEPVRAVRVRYDLPAERPLVLYVGGLDPHKNLDNLLRALSRVGLDGTHGWQLAVVGDLKGPQPEARKAALMALAGELSIADRITFTGYVPDEDLVALYNAAALLVLPSLDEGFGLPVVEAMACGVPVAVSARGSLPEVVGDAGPTFDPMDPDGMADVIREVLEDPEASARLRARGLGRAAEFSWERSARQLTAILEAVAAR